MICLLLGSYGGSLREALSSISCFANNNLLFPLFLRQELPASNLYPTPRFCSNYLTPKRQ